MVGIEGAGGVKRAALCRARIEQLKEYCLLLHNICNTNKSELVEVVYSKIFEHQLKLHEKVTKIEEEQALQIAELKSNQGVVSSALDVIKVILNNQEDTMVCTREAIAEAQALIENSLKKHEQTAKEMEELNNKYNQFQQRITEQQSEFEAIRARIGNEIILDEIELLRKAIGVVEDCYQTKL